MANRSNSNTKKEPKKPWLVRGLNKLGVSTSSGVEWLLGWVQALGVAGIAAWIILTFVLVRMTVPTGSMEPTIMVGDSFFVDKISFNFREPSVGDIIVFWKTDQDTGIRERLVKRLIATEGQQVQIKSCANPNLDRQECGVYVNNVKLTEDHFQWCYVTAGQMGDDVWTVPEDHYFVLGDNSRVSEDSRFWGYVPKEDFIGEPFINVWPFDSFGFMNGYLGGNRGQGAPVC